MRGKHLLEKIGFVDPKWVDETEKAKKNNRTLRRAATGVAAAALLALALGIGMQAFTHTQAFLLMPLAQNQEQMLRVSRCIVEHHIAEYQVMSLTDLQRERLAAQKGELYASYDDTRIYRLADREDLAYLIFEYNGVLKLGRFYQFDYFTSYESLQETMDQPDVMALFYPFPQEQLEQVVAVSSPAEALRIIYGLEGAEDIESVSFRKTDSDRSARGESVKVRRVTLREREDIAAFYDILCELDVPRGDDWQGTPSTERIAARLAQLQQQGIPDIQVDRTVRVKLTNGVEIEMHYDGAYGTLRIMYWQVRSPLNDEMNDWFIEHAEIDFTYQGYAENPDVPAGETATARPVPSDSADLPSEPTPE